MDFQELSLRFHDLIIQKYFTFSEDNFLQKKKLILEE